MVTGTTVDLYEVDYSESNTVFYLVEAYRGATGTGKAYAIDTSRTDSIPEFARRLNATLGAYQQQSDAFQALLTSDAATIEVTAPDGTKHTMIPWKRVTSEGEGQAARAKVEADKADAAAALAVNVVRDSAMPFPDVWAPLNDSLKMLAGHGREVKIGEDVVARYLPFSRATTAWFFDKSGTLRQAAINEPRFEAEGLLIEGQSTNHHKYSDYNGTYRTDQVGYNVTYTVVADARLGMSVARFSRDSTVATHTVVNRNVIFSGTNYYFCASALVKDDGAGTTELWLRDQFVSSNFSRVSLDFRTGTVARTEGGTFTMGAGGAIKKADGWWLVWASAQIPVPTTLQNQIYVKNSAAEAEGLLVAYTQIEVGYTPSSYIKTAGALAVRAADFCAVPTAGNLPSGAFTMSAQIHVPWLGHAAPSPAPRVFSLMGGETGSSVEATLYADGRFNAFGGVNGANSIVSGVPNNAIVAMVRTATGLNAYASGKKAVGSQGVNTHVGAEVALGGQNSGNGRHMYGHLRDVKIWHLEASDAQAKALR